MSSRAFISTILIPVFISCPGQTSAWSEAGRILTDPLKIDSGTENIIHAVERAYILAEKLLGQANQGLKDRISQVDSAVAAHLVAIDKIGDDFLEKGGAIVSSTMNSVNDLEAKMFDDAKELVLCGAAISGQEAKETAAAILNDLGKRRPKFTLFWGLIEFGAVEIDQSDWGEPIDAFDEFVAYSREVRANMTPSSPARELARIYGEGARLSHEIRCHYGPNNINYSELLYAELEYERLGEPWKNQIKVDL